VNEHIASRFEGRRRKRKRAAFAGEVSKEELDARASRLVNGEKKEAALGINEGGIPKVGFDRICIEGRVMISDTRYDVRVSHDLNFAKISTITRDQTDHSRALRRPRNGGGGNVVLWCRDRAG
jgi:hypothetical protein